MLLPDILVLVLFPGLMAFASASDLVSYRISNKVSLLLLASFPVVGLLVGLSWETIGLHLLVGVGVLVLTFVMFALNWVGGGDAKLAAATALWLGPGLLLEYLAGAAAVGGLITIALLAFRNAVLPQSALQHGWVLRLHDQKAGVPYGIALGIVGLLLYPMSPVWKAALGL